MIDTGMILVTLNTIGEAVLIETLKDAAFYWQHTNGHASEKHMRQSQESFMFVTGTGLEVIIQYYHLPYDARTLKRQFTYILGIRHAS